MSYSTMDEQVSHNLDKEAHPNIAGQLNMIEADVATNKGILDDNNAALGEMHDEQIRQGMTLKQIKNALDGGNR